MENNKEKGILCYDYQFNYFGEKKFEGQLVTGATVSIAFHITSDDGKEQLFDEETAIEINGEEYYLCDVISVSYDLEKGFEINPSLNQANKVIMEKLSGIHFEVVSYSIDVLEGTLRDNPTLSDNVKLKLGSILDLPSSRSITVSEEVFMNFVCNDEEFDISDNKNAQVPSSWIKTKDRRSDVNEINND
ncbi:hypothetical protein [Breznakia pachnodae]|uniref:Uncharacterized protein n=1 Tax=Breznakia pachnodae TaxID=265178 RepID=A0ABU0E3S3_9FIRM|nr:hypothetical protein [Breznakia pachnodae]MDQ0361547.1 hypothetical protein [Breznakia pachnodae]